MTNKLDRKDDPLPQDEAEGVDEDEWVHFVHLYISTIMFKVHLDQIRQKSEVGLSVLPSLNLCFNL